MQMQSIKLLLQNLLDVPLSLLKKLNTMSLGITIKYASGQIYQTASALNILKGKKYNVMRQAYVYIAVSPVPCFLDYIIGTIKVNLCQRNFLII